MDNMSTIHGASIYPLMCLASLVAVASLHTSITPSSLPLVLACFLAVGVILSSYMSKRDKRPPPHAPITYFQLVTKYRGKDLNLLVLHLTQTLGPIFRIPDAPFTNVTVVNDASVARAILNDPSALKPRNRYKMFDKPVDKELHPILLSKEGPVWRDTRKSVAHAFASRQVKRMRDVCCEKLEEWIRNTIDSKPGKSFDLFQEMSRLTFRIICKAAFEYDAIDDEMDMFITENSIFMCEFAVRQRKHQWRKWLKSVLPSVRRAYEAGEKISSFARHVLVSYREKVKLGNESREDTIIKLLENTSALKTDAEKIAEIVGFIAAGFQSTAYSMAWTLLELAKNPKIVESARDEIKGMSNIHDVAKSDCIQRIAREGQRKHPILQRITREVSRDIYTKNTGVSMNKSSPDLIIPKGSWVEIHFGGLQRSPAYYSNPDTFDPSRWINPSKEALDAFIPFALGQRNCVGQRLAHAELHTVIAKMIMDYNLEIEVEGCVFYGLLFHQKGTRLIAHKNVD